MENNGFLSNTGLTNQPQGAAGSRREPQGAAGSRREPQGSHMEATGDHMGTQGQGSHRGPQGIIESGSELQGPHGTIGNYNAIYFSWKQFPQTKKILH